MDAWSKSFDWAPGERNFTTPECDLAFPPSAPLPPILSNMVSDKSTEGLTTDLSIMSQALVALTKPNPSDVILRKREHCPFSNTR
jgi:hypothetical protein